MKPFRAFLTSLASLTTLVASVAGANDRIDTVHSVRAHAASGARTECSATSTPPVASVKRGPLGATLSSSLDESVRQGGGVPPSGAGGEYIGLLSCNCEEFDQVPADCRSQERRWQVERRPERSKNVNFESGSRYMAGVRRTRFSAYSPLTDASSVPGLCPVTGLRGAGLSEAGLSEAGLSEAGLSEAGLCEADGILAGRSNYFAVVYERFRERTIDGSDLDLLVASSARITKRGSTEGSGGACVRPPESGEASLQGKSTSVLRLRSLRAERRVFYRPLNRSVT